MSFACRLLAVCAMGLALALSSAGCSKGSPTAPSDSGPAPVFRFNTITYERDPSVEILNPQHLNAMGNHLVIARRITNGPIINDWPWQGVLECERVQMIIENNFSRYSCKIDHVQFTPGEYAVYFLDMALGVRATKFLSIDGLVLNRFSQWPTQFVTYNFAHFNVTSDGHLQ